MFRAVGPLEAAVDLKGGDGEGGFNELTFWHVHDNNVVLRIAKAFEEAGWKSCQTGDDVRGDQVIYSKDGSPFRVFMDISYYAKRRLRLIPEWNERDRRCTPK